MFVYLVLPYCNDTNNRFTIIKRTVLFECIIIDYLIKLPILKGWLKKSLSYAQSSMSLTEYSDLYEVSGIAFAYNFFIATSYLSKYTSVNVKTTVCQGWGQVQYLYLVLVLKCIFIST